MIKNIFLITCSIILFVATSNLLIQEVNFLINSKVARADIDNVECTEAMPKRFIGRTKNCLLRISFIDLHGKSQTAGYHLTLYRFSQKEMELANSKVDIRYNPLNPREVQRELNFIGTLMLLVFPISSLILLIAVILRIRKGTIYFKHL